MRRRREQPRFFVLFMRYWLPLLAYITTIIFLSAQPYLRPPLQFHESDKLYHVLEYLGLGVLLARAAHASAASWRPVTVALASLLGGILVGTSDEYIQSFVPGRDSSGFDLLADTAGLALAQVLYRAFIRD